LHQQAAISRGDLGVVVGARTGQRRQRTIFGDQVPGNPRIRASVSTERDKLQARFQPVKCLASCACDNPRLVILFIEYILNILNTEEDARLKSLLEYNILDTEAREGFRRSDPVGRGNLLACQWAVSIVNATRRWFKANVGIALCEIDRQIVFCNYTIQQKNPLIVPDALKDSRFAESPLVTKDPHVRFYAGYPLHSREGCGLGNLCVFDRIPRELTGGPGGTCYYAGHCE
jgi:hypothetical protein